jgi:hypothetical protein
MESECKNMAQLESLSLRQKVYLHGLRTSHLYPILGVFHSGAGSTPFTNSLAFLYVLGQFWGLKCMFV